MQTAPGIGIDLTMAYGAAAINFHNGTTRNLIQIHGSQEYRSAMKTLSEDAQNVRNGKNSTMKRIELPLPNKVLNDWWSPWMWYRFLSDKLQPILNGRVVPPEEEQPDDWVYTVAYMLSKIKSTAIDPIEPPLKFNYVLLSWPDFEFDTGHLYRGRIQLACRLAGLELMPRSNVVSVFAPASEYNDEWGNQAEATMLVISYNAASLGITWNYSPPLWYTNPRAST
ncbi:hypothetical protein N7476_002000 [Penicillium atrosanguineum]|uniref:Uncharacterized protein n=1 Tax=Penicillium atrosanguineum TaxID=1132637 RepID=A0A9W9Q2J4_9EURO|nr:hypothetical protein N7526_006160 [Penicillium atrosanguineum]KAJ5323400.1 hypothetical protein N7476_002000 [Penicillium atrosanguineum]